MLIKFLEDAAGSHTFWPRGSTAEWPEADARKYIERGYAVRVIQEEVTSTSPDDPPTKRGRGRPRKKDVAHGRKQAL